MAKKKEFTIESLTADVEAFKNGHFSKTNMTTDWMDAYVAKFHSDEIEAWITKCLSIPMATREIGGVERKVMDSKAIREYFIATYFPDYTDEAKELAKQKKKSEREQAKAKKEAEKNLTPEEKLRAKMQELAQNK